ncbi:putative minor fimbrial subunit StfF [Serratia entomophila]|uniref:fimbrial protein n=1 Tax=Serratia entomophila TaxID=42906 RepID=UPI00217B0F36|nr:fimbrial protein [Serratia entomophila]CAI1130965.1 putative minor fimbrial subunit StfF [Serratia entomophila]
MKKLGTVCLILLGITACEVSAAENMSFKGTLREDVPCEFNGGQSINVDFGTVGINRIDGERYRKSFAVDITCPSGFDVPFKISYVGKPSDFDSSALATNIDGLGIKAQEQINGGWSDLAVDGYMSGVGSIKRHVQVVPVKSPSEVLTPGGF